MRNEELPTPREVSGNIIRYGVAAVFGLFVVGGAMYGLGLGFWAATKPANFTAGVVDRVIDPDRALESYRWFHGAYQATLAKKGQIALAKGALDAASEDRKEARRVETLGLQQNCMTLVGEYNARAQRADTVIFMHPELFLPGNWPGDRNPLPQSLDPSACL